MCPITRTCVLVQECYTGSAHSTAQYCIEQTTCIGGCCLYNVLILGQSVPVLVQCVSLFLDENVLEQGRNVLGDMAPLSHQGEP